MRSVCNCEFVTSRIASGHFPPPTLQSQPSWVTQWMIKSYPIRSNSQLIRQPHCPKAAEEISYLLVYVRHVHCPADAILSLRTTCSAAHSPLVGPAVSILLLSHGRHHGSAHIPKDYALPPPKTNKQAVLNCPHRPVSGGTKSGRSRSGHQSSRHPP
jgi:hypothetical protein